MEYKVVIGQTTQILENKVNQMMEKDFVPLGGIAVQLVTTLNNASLLYIQAMIKITHKEGELHYGSAFELFTNFNVS